MKRTYQTKVQKRSEEDEKKKEKREKCEKAADDYKRGKFKQKSCSGLRPALHHPLQGLLFLSLTFSKDKYYITKTTNNNNN